MLIAFDRETPIQVLYRDEQLIAVHKPAGMVVHPTDLAREEKISLMGLVRRIVGQKVWPVHRLDRPTSGVVVFALERNSATELARQFREHEVDKRYLAVVRGTPADQTIDHPLKERPLYRSDMARALPQDAVTKLSLIDAVELPLAVGRYPTSRYALVELSPVSGRRHQLRRHSKHIFHPIIGDTTYGDGVHNRFFRDQFACHRLLLTAVSLKLTQPQTQMQLSLQTALDDDFQQLLKKLELSLKS